MGWLEVSVRVNREAAEAVAEVLSRYAPEGVVLDFSLPEGPLDKTQQAVEQATMVTVKAYLPADGTLEARRQKVEEGLWHLSQIWSAVPEPVFRSVPDQDWNALWKAQIPVLTLGHNVVIKPSWRDYEPGPDEIVIEMDPGMAFGTGLHPTTQLCVTASEELIRPGMAVLDLGTGTGILAMIAAHLGAAPLRAVDNDADAVAAARRNIEANRLEDQIDLRHGTLEDDEGAYDLILANLLAPIIIRLAPGLASHLRPGGYLVASGILEEQSEDVAAILENADMEVTERRGQEEWVALIARRLEPPTI